MTRQYGWRPDGLWGADPLYLKQGGQSYYYHNDHLGTPQKLVSVTGQVVWEARYQAFGEAQAAGTVENPLRFPGQYYDAETGMHYNYFRYYDPVVGRYLRTDPLGLAGGINMFVYTGNNVVNFIDPFGLETLPKSGNPTRAKPYKFRMPWFCLAVYTYDQLVLREFIQRENEHHERMMQFYQRNCNMAWEKCDDINLDCKTAMAECHKYAQNVCEKMGDEYDRHFREIDRLKDEYNDHLLVTCFPF